MADICRADYFRSFGLRLPAILQSPSQLRTNYSVEGAKTFEQSFDCSVFYTPSPRDLETSELLSKLLGNNTVKGKSESKKKGFETKYDSTSTSDQKRALMLPQEVMRMHESKEIILISGLAPIFAKKVRAWEEPLLLTRRGEAPVPPKVQLTTKKPGLVDVSALPVIEDPQRLLEASDVGRLHEKELEDFSADFSDVKFPKGVLNAAEMADVTDAFLTKATVDEADRAEGREPGE